jgi:Ca2+-binding RTX toxin-like protein
VERLGERVVPAVVARVTPHGQLVVRITDDSRTAQHVDIGHNNGYLSVVSYAPDGAVRNVPYGRRVAASAVRGITVIGSDLNNTIDLRGVSTSAFRGLHGRIGVNARGGNDFLLGSNFGETLVGGEGDDVIWAHGGADRLYGGDGFDQLNGGVGNDLLSGGYGPDWVYGGDGNDSLTDFRPWEGDWCERDVERR